MKHHFCPNIARLLAGRNSNELDFIYISLSFLNVLNRIFYTKCYFLKDLALLCMPAAWSLAWSCRLNWDTCLIHSQLTIYFKSKKGLVVVARGAVHFHANEEGCYVSWLSSQLWLELQNSGPQHRLDSCLFSKIYSKITWMVKAGVNSSLICDEKRC